MLNIVIFGAPGAGKGTQAERIINKYGLHHISTGEVIRKEIASGSQMGKDMECYIAKGEFAPDELVVDIVSEYLGNNKNVEGNIFDGFPRNLPQAEAFDELMQRHGMKIDMMLSLEVPDEELIRRLQHRGTYSGRVDDCDVNVIRKRLDIYKKTTTPVADYYADQGKHIAVDGTGTMEEIFDRIAHVLDKHLIK